MKANVKTSKRSRFTLIELMVVVIIVAVLAAIAVPLYSSQVNRAKASEAVAGLGAIRSAQRIYKSEHGSYLAVSGSDISNPMTDADSPGLGLDFADNKYFDAAAFAVTTSGDGFTATCTGASSTANSKSDVDGFIITMNEEGTVDYTYP